MRVPVLIVAVTLLQVKIVFPDVVYVPSDEDYLPQSSSTSNTGFQNLTITTNTTTGSEHYTLRETCDQGMK